MTENWNGADRRVSGGRRNSDFCSEHCLLKQVYEGKFSELKSNEEKARESLIKAYDKVEKRHYADKVELDKALNSKASWKLIVLLIAIVVGSTGGLWTELRKISDKLSSVSAKQEIVLRSHSNSFFFKERER